MESLKQNFIWLTEDAPAFDKELSGTFMTSLEGVPCTLELKVNYKSLQGSLTLDEQIFQIRAVISNQIKAAYGVLIEPMSNTPVALLRITPERWGVKLELDMPDFEVKILYQPHSFRLLRTASLLV